MGHFRVGDQVRERKGKVAGDEIGGQRVADKAKVMQGLADFAKTLGFNLNTMECLRRVSEQGLACPDYIL